LLLTFLKSSYDEAGTSARYGPTFLPCYGYDASQLPSSNFFAAAGNGVWDNGAACGRQYWVKCAGGTCVGQVIQVKIVGYVVTSVSQQSHEGSTMVLSHSAFRAIANSTADSVRKEFQRYVILSPYLKILDFAVPLN
nr:hypothetical protein [Tanacetum cinerariifolium]